MASQTYNLNTWVAKRIIGDNSTATATNALLHNGGGRGNTATGDTWIYYDDASAANTPWGFKHDQPNDKISFYGAGTNTSWLGLGTGNFYISGKAGIGYDPGTSGNTYSLYVNGSSYFTGAVSVPSTLTVRAENTTNEGGQICLTADPDHSTYPAYLDVCANYFRIHSNGQERFSVNLSSYGTSKFTGLLQITKNSNTVTIGSQNTSFTHIYNSADIPFIFNKSVLTAAGSLGDTTYPWNNLYIGKGDGAGIYYVTANYTKEVIRFLNHSADQYGVGLKICTGGLIIIGAGESGDTIQSNLSPASGSETLYLASDGSILFYPDQNSYDAAAQIKMTAGKIWAGVNGNTTRENQVGVQSGSGQLYMYAQAATSANRGIYIPAHGSGAAKAVVNIDTNNRVYFADSYNGSGTALAYSQAGLAASAITWLTCWNGYELRAISKAETFNLVRDNGGDSRWCTLGTEQTISGVKHFTGNLWWGSSNGGGYLNGGATNGGINSVRIGDDVWLGDCNQGGIMGMKSTGSNCGFWFYNSGGTNIGQFYCAGTSYIYTNRYFYMPGVTVGTSWVSSRDQMGLKVDASDSTSSVAYTVCGVKFSSVSYGISSERAGQMFGIFGWTNARTENGYDWGFYINSDRYFHCNTRIYNAVWNDYAEYRQGETTEGGRAVYDDGTGIMKITTERLQAAARLVSDTYGFAVGESDTAHTPIGVGGRVLAYTYRNRKEYKVGDVVCAAPNGTVDIMTREEIREYPDRMIGIVSEIPNYETWKNNLGNGERGKAIIPVNGRIWIYVK